MTQRIISQKPIGVVTKDDSLYMLFSLEEKGSTSLFFIKSVNGTSFASKKYYISLPNLESIDSIRISQIDNKYILLYKAQSVPSKTRIRSFISENLFDWKESRAVNKISENGAGVVDYLYKKQHVFYYGNQSIYVAFSRDLIHWILDNELLIEPRSQMNELALIPAASYLTSKYIMLLYYVLKEEKGIRIYSIGLSLLYKEDPRIQLWRNDTPLWKLPNSWNKKHVEPIGIAYHKEKILSYWYVDKQIFVVTSTPPIHLLEQDDQIRALTLEKYEQNPIISPIEQHSWESKATFNTAVVNERGKVHFLYRAIGDKDTSVLGYASSRNGENIDERAKEPVYTSREPFESPGMYPVSFARDFVSGGGYGGIEDPRITRIDDKLYMTYVAFNGYNHPRIAITSIHVDDFLNKRWNWSAPKLISKPGEVNKNACLLPEKVRGKYVMFHRVFPNILIDFVDDLEFREYLKGEYKITPRAGLWDSLKIGAGAPPLKTRDGWLLIYQAVGEDDSGRYKIGAMLLDLDDPVKVRARSINPILEPREWYENQGWKAGVAYPCGATILHDELFVYYGGADTVVCVAKQKLAPFLKELKNHKEAHLNPSIQVVRLN